MTLNKRIDDLMKVAPENHDMNWLKRSLQSAVEVEFFTIPPYLTALWSIKDPSSFAARSIRVIFREEMLHMGLMCNLLTAIGGVPQINDPKKLPSYPHELPGHIHSGLYVSMQGLSDAALDIFMAVELPENGSVVESNAAASFGITETFSTIGAFYTAIMAAFEINQPALSPVNQLEDSSLGLFKITNISAGMTSVKEAVGIIKKQGEGADGSPEDSGPTDLAHYYRFGEIRHRKKLQKNEVTGKWNFDGADVAFPDTFPVAVIPEDGYKKENVTSEIWEKLEEFDRNYTTMINLLQTAWQGGLLDNAVTAMFGLEDSAIFLMGKTIPGSKGNYGPCFRLV